MLLRITIYLNTLVFLVLIPFLEISATHVFNPDWPAHARLHEVWQLATNGLLSALTAYLVTQERYAIVAGAIALTINAGFLTALASADAYSGGMVHSDGSELLVAGANPASAIATAITLAICLGLLQVWRCRHAGMQADKTAMPHKRSSTRRWSLIGPVIVATMALLVAIYPVPASATDCQAAPAFEPQIDKILTQARSRSGTPGIAVGILVEGEVVYLKGDGVRHSASMGDGVDCHTRFHVASLSKPVVATAILTAIERGEIRAGDTVADLVAGSNIPATILGLMTHSVGMRNWSRADARRDLHSKDVYFRHILQRASRTRGSHRHRYSDTNYNLLGLVIERTSGSSLQSFVNARVFEPLGMTQSSFDYGINSGPNTAWPHLGRHNRPAANHPYDIAFAASSGLQSSARDMVLFMQAYLEADANVMGQALYDKAVEPLTKSEWDGIEQSPVWQVFERDGDTVLQHGGSDKGFRALITIYPASNAGIVILANGEQLDRWLLRSQIEMVIGL